MGSLNFDQACREMLGVDPETVTEWFDQDESTKPFRNPPLRDRALSIFAAGIWLHRRLVENGVSKKDADDACSAAGQMMAMNPNPWDVACRQLCAVVEDGAVVIPGPSLAQALFDGRRTARARRAEHVEHPEIGPGSTGGN